MIYSDLVAKMNLSGTQENPKLVMYGCTIFGIIITPEIAKNEEKIKEYVNLSLTLYRYMKVKRNSPQEFEKTSKIHVFVADSVDSYEKYISGSIYMETRRTVLVIPPNETELGKAILKPFIVGKTDEELQELYEKRSQDIGLCMLVCDKQTHRFHGKDRYQYAFF